MFFPFLEENIVTYSGNFLSTIFTGKSEIGPRITRYGSDYSPIYVVILLLLVVSSVVGTWKNLTTGIINVLLGLLIALYAIAIGYLFDNKIAKTDFKIGYYAMTFLAICFLILTIVNLGAIIKNRSRHGSTRKRQSNILDS
jgi:hypothetical protein